MSLTLSATLQTAQDGISHHPIVELLSISDEAIPFDGADLTNSQTNETKPACLMHSTGSLLNIYLHSTDTFKFVYSDVNRESFNFVTLSLADLGASGTVLIESSITELTDATVGIIFSCHDGSNFYLRQTIVNAVGVVQSNALIATFSKGSYDDLKSPFVITLANNSYYLVYILDDSATVSKIYKRTSADFSSWAAAVQISLTGLTTNISKNISLCQIASGNIFLMLDYYDDTSYANIYYAISADNGGTWTAAVALTTYASSVAYALHPFGVQKNVNEIYIIYYEQKSAQTLEDGEGGWPAATQSTISSITIDETGDKAYIVNSLTAAGTKVLYHVLELDLVNYEVTNYWNSGTTPAYNTMWTAAGMLFWNRCFGARYYIPIAFASDVTHRHVALLDAQGDTITEYHFNNWGAYSITKNVDYSEWGIAGNAQIESVWVDFDSLRLYICFTKYVGVSTGQIEVGYIDITDAGPTYEWTEVVRVNDLATINAWDIAYFAFFGMYNSANWFIYSSHATGTYEGKIIIFDSSIGGSYTDGGTTVDIDTGGVYKNYNRTTYPTFPMHGFLNFTVIGIKIYGVFTYESGYGESEKRGLCEIDTSTDNIVYHRPTWADLNDYTLGHLISTDGGDLIICSSYGLSVFDVSAKTWKLINNDSNPGLTDDANDYFLTCAYDNDTDRIYGGASSIAFWTGFVSTDSTGYLQQPCYKIGTLSGTWSFGSASNFISSNNDSDVTVIVDPDDSSFYSFWTQRINTEYSIRWDKEVASFDLDNYLVTDEDIVIEKTVENTPNHLRFALAKGYLFDATNNLAMHKVYVKKGSPLTLRLGEKVGGTNYWHEQGTWIVKQKELVYERGKLPIMRIECEDLRSIWQTMELAATGFWDGDYPETVLSELLQNYADVDVGDISISNFDNRTKLYTQWTRDTPVLEILNEICDRYCYFHTLDVDNNFICRKISDENATDHTYSSKNDYITYTFSDKFSEFVTKVWVDAQERDFMTATYPEKSVAMANGTIGWWQGKQSIIVPFQPDYGLICVNPVPTMHTHFTRIFNFKDENNLKAQLVIDDSNTFVTIEIEAANMLNELATALAGLWGAYTLKDVPILGWAAIGAIAVFWQEIIHILCSVSNWQIEIKAQPQGKVRREVHAYAEDKTFKAEIGDREIEKHYFEPLAYTEFEAQEVANNEIMISKLQRKRLLFTKPGHLQDEEGDTIEFIHPYSLETLKIFVSRITRTIKKPSRSGSGGVFDEIEGWRIE